MAPRDEDFCEVSANRVSEARIDYRRGGPADVEGLVRLARGAYGGDIAEWRARLARALGRDDIYLVLADRCGVTVG